MQQHSQADTSGGQVIGPLFIFKAACLEAHSELTKAEILKQSMRRKKDNVLKANRVKTQTFFFFSTSTFLPSPGILTIFWRSHLHNPTTVPSHSDQQRLTDPEYFDHWTQKCNPTEGEVMAASLRSVSPCLWPSALTAGSKLWLLSYVWMCMMVIHMLTYHNLRLQQGRSTFKGQNVTFRKKLKS